MDTVESAFNLWVKQRRRGLDLTQEDLADCVGCSTIAIQKIESGQRRPSRQVARRLAECLRLPADRHEAFVTFARGEEAAAQLPAGPAAQATAVPPPPPPPNNLPTPLTPLLGRAVVLPAAVDYLLSGEIRLVTLVGEPGIGKTRLSLAVAAQLLPHFQDGVYFVELASISEPDLVASTIGATLGYKEMGSGSFIDGLKRFINDRTMLLVLDNFEQVLDAAPVVIELLSACPALKILVTSREALHIMGEQQLPVPPLEVLDLTRLPDAHGEQALLGNPAVELFMQRACAVDPGFALTEENYRIVAAICARLEGLPLAIELAAARIKMLAPMDLLSRLESSLMLLTGGPRHLPERLQTLRGAIDWSYRLLSPAEQSLFTCLGVFVGGATLPAIQAVYGMRNDEFGMRNTQKESIPHSYDVLEGVGSLVEKNLLRPIRDKPEESIPHSEFVIPHSDGPRFVMLEMVREYAWEKLLESGEAEGIRRAHALYFVQLAEEAHRKVWGLEEPIWLDRLEAEHDNLRAALQWCLRRDDGLEGVETGLRLVGALGRFWDIRGYLSEGRVRMASVLSIPETRDPEVRELRARALQYDAGLAFWQSDYSAVRLELEEALAIFQELGHKAGIARTLIDLADLARTQGDYDTSTQMCKHALALCRELGDTHGTLVSLVVLGWAEIRPGSYAQATAHFEEALTLARQLQFPNRIALVLSGLGEAMVRQDEHERATAFLEESLAMRRATGYRWGTAATIGTLGWAALRRGDLGRASQMLTESLTLRKELGDKGGVAWCLEKLAEVVTAQGRPLRAAVLLGAAGALRESIHADVDIADVQDFERTVTAVRRGLSGQVFSMAWAEGEAMTFEQAIAYAQAVSDRSAPETLGSRSEA